MGQFPAAAVELPAVGVAEAVAEGGQHSHAAVGAGAAAQGQDDPAGFRLRANRMASPKPRLEAPNGSSCPPGSSPRPQVLATSTTAVSPSNAMLGLTCWPVGPATV